MDKALQLAKQGRIKEAEALYQQQLSKKPISINTLRGAITFHNRYSHRFRQALPLVDTLLKRRPKSADSYTLAAETYANCSRLPQAAAFAEKAVSLFPKDPDALFIRAYVAMQQGQYQIALEAIEHALELRPDHAPAQLQKCRALLSLGDTDAARIYCLDLLDTRPEDINLIGLYVDATKFTSDDPVLAAMRDVLLPKYEQIGGQNLSHLLKLLGKAYNDTGAYDDAFAAFTRAKTVTPMTYDAKGYATFVSTLKAQISRADYFGKGMPSQQPVLIVGMPRSGSTLIEQILASHPQIQSIGESPSLQMIVQDIGVPYHKGPLMARAIKSMPATEADALARRYLAEMGHPDAVHVLDKSLHNFELLGVFAAMFPQARIIHAHRDPMDTCVSCYMQPLSAWHRYTQTLESLGHAYGLYRDLMDHWKAMLPNPILDVQYEDTVKNIEDVARKMVDFLGLDWDPACLAFQDSGTHSLTLSARQVREPLYTSAMQRWRRYEAHLDPLKKHLNRFYPQGI